MQIHAQSLYVWVPAHWAPCICTIVKNRTVEFDRKRDHEAILARAWGHEVEQQAQRDGAGIANATVVDGVGYFLPPLTCVQELKTSPPLSSLSEPRGLSFPLLSLSTPCKLFIKECWMVSFASALLLLGLVRSANGFR